MQDSVHCLSLGLERSHHRQPLNSILVQPDRIRTCGPAWRSGKTIGVEDSSSISSVIRLDVCGDVTHGGTAGYNPGSRQPEHGGTRFYYLWSGLHHYLEDVN
jgi:hypothetical protein